MNVGEPSFLVRFLSSMPLDFLGIFLTSVYTVNGRQVSEGDAPRFAHAKDQAAYLFLLAGGFITAPPF